MTSFFLIFFYYWVIIFSIIGHGLLFSKFILKQPNSNINIGYIGLYGIFSLLLISYFSSFFLAHDLFFNLIIIIFGLIYFFVSFKKNLLSNNFKILIIIYSLLLITIYAAKQHDDFGYYHFPYTQLLTEYSGLIGIGNFNHGFRTHSSIFYLSSLFYLPFIKYFLFHLTPVFFLGFSNFILYKKIKDYLDTKNNLYLLFLSLFSLVFVNVFFYRLAEHGTDRSAMVLIIILVIEIMYLINLKKNYEKDFILNPIILISIIFSLKAFYIIYLPLFLVVLFYYKEKNKLIIFLLKNKVFYFCISLIFICLFTNFLNTGCLIYPANFLCYENFQWSIPLKEVEQMNLWYQQWSKAGANPNFRVENPEEYIKNFNWLSNWFQMYFFNKVSDFLLGIVFLIFLFMSIFFRKKIKTNKKKLLLLYIILLILFFEWFYFHPALRYGGYHLIALLFFLPVSILLEKYSGLKINFDKKVYLIIFLGILVFLTRNAIRLNKEYRAYNYNPIKNAYYKDFQQTFLINESIKKIIMCIDKKTNESCENNSIKAKKIFNSYMFYKKK